MKRRNFLFLSVRYTIKPIHPKTTHKYKKNVSYRISRKTRKASLSGKPDLPLLPFAALGNNDKQEQNKFIFILRLSVCC